jgi:hypothetical protein
MSDSEDLERTQPLSLLRDVQAMIAAEMVDSHDTTDLAMELIANRRLTPVEQPERPDDGYWAAVEAYDATQLRGFADDAEEATAALVVSDAYHTELVEESLLSVAASEAR